ncbi:hypothetical protein B6U98_03970 [Thermoplasmatales archaeon ex4572_165]|nr:MAG: hypothetical protein B6U98_03970 [Thermoplasmatales archaeon ex4572_165]
MQPPIFFFFIYNSNIFILINHTKCEQVSCLLPWEEGLFGGNNNMKNKNKIVVYLICMMLITLNISIIAALEEHQEMEKPYEIIEQIDPITNEKVTYFVSYLKPNDSGDKRERHQRMNYDDNLIPNPSFEDGQGDMPDGWTSYVSPSNSECLFLWDSNEAYSGSKSIGISNFYDASHYCKFKAQELIPFRWSYNYDYELTIWYKHNKVPTGQNQNALFSLDFYNEDQEYLTGFGWTLWKSYSTEWTQFDYNFNFVRDFIKEKYPEKFENTRFIRFSLGMFAFDNNLDVDSSFEVRFDDLYLSYTENITPETPTGPEEGDVDEELTYSVVTADPLDRQVYYKWSWGDGTESDWLGPFESGETITYSHAWTEKGIYTVKAKAKNSEGLESEWSQGLIIGIPLKKDGEDQVQNDIDGGYGRWSGMFAQSFIPLENTLSQVSLFVIKKGEPGNIKVSIRKELEDEDLIVTEVSSGGISDERYNWITFDFSDIDIISGETYYITWTPFDSDSENVVYWGIAADNPYSNGCAWQTYPWGIFNPIEYPNPDFCFKTFYAKDKHLTNHLLSFLGNYPQLLQLLRNILGLW